MQSPILLFAQADNVATNQTIQIGESSTFKNPYIAPMYIDEIRMEAVTAAGSIISPSGPFANNVNILMSFWISQQAPLCWAVPISLLGKRLQDDGTYCWRLPKPLYIPYGAYVRCEVRVVPTSESPPAPMGIRVTYLGRSLGTEDPVPNVIQVPWAASFVTQEHDVESPWTEASTESDLVNPFPQTLFLQRFLGSIPGQFGPDYNAGIGAEVIKVRIVDHMRRIVVRDNTPVNQAFFQADLALTVNTVMEPRSFFLAYFSGNSSFFVDPAISGLFKAAVSIVGYRNVPIRGVY